MSGSQKHEKRYEIIRARQDAPMKYNVAGKTIKFGGKKQSFIIKDAGIAKELEARHGGLGGGRSADDSLRVIPVDNWQSDVQGIHKYFFGVNPKVPGCAEPGCTRKSWLGKYCPDHKQKQDKVGGKQPRRSNKNG